LGDEDVEQRIGTAPGGDLEYRKRTLDAQTRQTMRGDAGQLNLVN